MTSCVTATKVAPTPDLLGESPVWDDRLGRLYWVDGVSRLIRCHDPEKGTFTSLQVPSMIGSIALSADPDRLVAGLADGIYMVTLSSGALEPLFRPEPADTRIRFNDGKVDRQGRFLCGTMGVQAEPLGELIRLSAAGDVDRLATGIRISNAICFSPDGETLYFADSLDRAIRSYRYDESEALTEPRIQVDTSFYSSGPDGATVDSEGYLWVALVQAGKIGRFAPDGSLDRMMQAPVDLPSCVAFGGPEMSTLFVTSIKDSGSGRAISRHPSGGHVFALEGLGVTGIPEPKFC